MALIADRVLYMPIVQGATRRTRTRAQEETDSDANMELSNPAPAQDSKEERRGGHVDLDAESQDGGTTYTHALVNRGDPTAGCHMFERRTDQDILAKAQLRSSLSAQNVAACTCCTSLTLPAFMYLHAQTQQQSQPRGT